MLYEAFDLLDELEATTKRNEKIEILSRGLKNEALKEILYLAYNPFMMYNIVSYGEVNITNELSLQVSEVEGLAEKNFNRFTAHLELLTSRTLTGGEAIATITTFFNTLTEREYKWYSRVLKKDLRAGITDKTINKVFKGLIPTFDCMLAKSWEDVKKKPKEVIYERKLDGYRNVSFVNTDMTTELFTRNGKPIEGFKAIEEELKKLPKGMVYDGELIGKVNEFEDMQKLVFNKKLKEKEATFVIFDMIPIEEFKAGKSKRTLRERKVSIARLGEHLYDLEHIQFEVGSEVVEAEKDWDIIEQFYEWCITSGLEGIMIKDANSYYECKRSSSWLKLKPFELADLEVIGSVEGLNKNAGKLGALVVDWKGYEVEVGSGFSDEERETLWETRNELVGKVISVQYQDETSNEKGTKSLRFPSFKGFRIDKE